MHGATPPRFASQYYAAAQLVTNRKTSALPGIGIIWTCASQNFLRNAHELLGAYVDSLDRLAGEPRNSSCPRLNDADLRSPRNPLRTITRQGVYQQHDEPYDSNLSAIEAAFCRAAAGCSSGSSASARSTGSEFAAIPAHRGTEIFRHAKSVSMTICDWNRSFSQAGFRFHRPRRQGESFSSGVEE